MMKNVIFDLDGTLADCSHRRHYVEGDNKDWDAFFAECGKDVIIKPIARLFRFYRESTEHKVFILSGRMGSEKAIRDTENWLMSNDLWPINEEDVCYGMQAHLHLRENGDYRSDVEVKLEMIRRLGLTPKNTEIVFDDRDCMVKAWREWGFQCCQVAEGDF